MQKTKGMLSLMGGAALGAVAMYLLDPESGEDRRHRLGERASNAMEGAGSGLSDGWQTLAAKAKEFAARAGEYGTSIAGQASDQAGGTASGVSGYASRVAREAADYARQLSQQAKDVGSDWSSTAARSAAGAGLADFGSRVADRVRGWTSGISSSAGDWSDEGRSAVARARDASGRLLHRAGNAVGGEEEHGIIAPVAISAVTCCAIGAGVMYLFDPERGQKRREFLMEKTQDCVRETGNLFRQTGRSLRQQISRVSHLNGGGGSKPASGEGKTTEVTGFGTTDSGVAAIGSRVQGDKAVTQHTP